MTTKVLVTGSAGLVGSQAIEFFCKKGFIVTGVDNNMRKYFFGNDADTSWNAERLKKTYKEYSHYNGDIRDKEFVGKLMKDNKFDIIVHTAAQPSHDWAAKEPFTDFEVNAYGTLIMLENFRQNCPDASFIFTSTNKVYGDTPNRLPVIEQETRYELPKSHPYYKGIDESMSIDNSMHSIFGASKVAADVMVQEYGKYFGLNTVAFRCGCITGQLHSGTKLHGFLSYLIRCILKGEKYTIFGYKGKQVRDNIHSYDLVNAFFNFHEKPRQGEAYNMGGGRHSNISVIEAIKRCEEIIGKKLNHDYVESSRRGDHIWWISDTSKFKSHYPNWKHTYDTDKIIKETEEFQKSIEK
jgi:CDP-paratose 2-epimerase